MFLFNGDIKFPGYSIKLLLILPVLARWFFTARNRMPGSVRFFWYLGIASLTLSFIVVYESGQLQTSEQITYFLTNYLFLLLAPACLMAVPFVDLQRLSRVLVFVTFPLVVLGIAQHFLSKPLLPTASEDGSLFITSWDFFDVRAFSLFGSGLDFSCFLALMTRFFVACVVVKRPGYPGRLMSTIGVGLCLIATYATLTRAAYLVVLQSAVVGWLLSRGRTIGRMKWFAMPVIGTLIAFLAIIILPGKIATLYPDLLDNQSLVERLLNWGLAVQTWRRSNGRWPLSSVMERRRVCLTRATSWTTISSISPFSREWLVSCRASA